MICNSIQVHGKGVIERRVSLRGQGICVPTASLALICLAQEPEASLAVFLAGLAAWSSLDNYSSSQHTWAHFNYMFALAINPIELLINILSCGELHLTNISSGPIS